MTYEECLLWADRLETVVEACRASDGDRAYEALSQWFDAYDPNWRGNTYDDFLCGGQSWFRAYDDESAQREWGALAPFYSNAYDTLITVEHQLEQSRGRKNYSDYEAAHNAPLLLTLQAQRLFRYGTPSFLPIGTEIARTAEPRKLWRITRHLIQPYHRWFGHHVTYRGYCAKRVGDPGGTVIFSKHSIWPGQHWDVVRLPPLPASDPGQARRHQ